MRAITWALIGLVGLVIVILFVALPARREEEIPFPVVSPEIGTPIPTFEPTPSPTPEALTPEQEQLADLEAAEKTDLVLEADMEQDLNKTDRALRGI